MLFLLGCCVGLSTTNEALQMATVKPVPAGAENYHQDYYRLNKNRNPYCRMVIAPKLWELHLPE